MTSWFGRSSDSASKKYMSQANVLALIKKNDRKVSSERRKTEKIMAQAEEKIKQFQQVMSRGAMEGSSMPKPKSASLSSSRSQANLLRELADAAADAQAYATAYPAFVATQQNANSIRNSNAFVNANANANARARELIARSKPTFSNTDEKAFSRAINAYQAANFRGK